MSTTETGAEFLRLSKKYEEERDAVQARADEAKDRIDEAYAQRFLVHYRALLRGSNLRRHKFTIRAAMGVAFLLVNGEQFLPQDLMPKFNRRSSLVQLLEGIQESLDYDWAYYLDGEELN